MTPHTLSAFSASFHCTQGRQPTIQEVFDAGMRAGRDLKSRELKSVFYSAKGDDTQVLSTMVEALEEE